MPPTTHQRRSNNINSPAKLKTLSGTGLGLRLPHIHQIIAEKPEIDWLEIHSCNFLNAPINLALLDQVAECYPLSFHGVSLNLGGPNNLDHEYLKQLKHLIKRYQPELVSDHACFTAMGNQHFHDLLPVPYTEEAADHFSQRINEVQETLEREILIENISRYISYPPSQQQLTEAQFLSAITSQTQCGLLLDINNAYINQSNHMDEPRQQVCQFIRALPQQHIKEIHLGGHHNEGGQLIDSHSSEVSESVWQLFSQYCEDFFTSNHSESVLPAILIEWDNALPPLEKLMQQAQRAKATINSAQDLTRKNTHAVSSYEHPSYST
ncbi:MAG: DUF692 domain-containing protein [Cellvibrionaceae bacterium]